MAGALDTPKASPEETLPTEVQQLQSHGENTVSWAPAVRCISNAGAVCLSVCPEQRTYNLLGWPKGLFRFFHKVEDTFSISTNNCIDLDTLSMSAVSHVV